MTVPEKKAITTNSFDARITLIIMLVTFLFWPFKLNYEIVVELALSSISIVIMFIIWNEFRSFKESQHYDL